MAFEYKGSTPIISGLIQENNADFPIARASDIVVDNGTDDGIRLDKYLENIGTGGGGGSTDEGYTTKWLLNDKLNLPVLFDSPQPEYNFPFMSAGEEFVKVSGSNILASYIRKDGTALLVINRRGWVDDTYKTIYTQKNIEDIDAFVWLNNNGSIVSGEVYPPYQRAYDTNLYTENKTVVGAINEIYNGGGGTGGGGGGNTDTDTETNDMPTIRFIGLVGNRALWEAGNGVTGVLTFSVEVSGAPLQVNDALQICGMRTFKACPQNPRDKRKLRRFAEHSISESEILNGYKYFNITVEPTKNAMAHLGHNNRQGGGPTTIYFRIRRPVGDLQGNNSGMTVSAKFSNVVPVPIMYSRSYGYNADGSDYDIITVNPI